MASEVTVKGCGGQAIRQLSQAPTAWQVTLPCFPGPGLLTQEPLLPHAGGSTRPARKGAGQGSRPDPLKQCEVHPSTQEGRSYPSGWHSRGTTLWVLRSSVSRPQASRQGGRCVTIARPPAPCPPKLHPREGVSDKGSGAARLAPEPHSHISLRPARRSSGAGVTRDLLRRVSRGGAAARSGEGSLPAEDSSDCCSLCSLSHRHLGAIGQGAPSWWGGRGCAKWAPP